MEITPYSERIGQKGIISSLAVCPDYSDTFAAGSFARSVGIYSYNTNKRVLMLKGIDFGVTHMKYAPQASHILWVGGRKSSHVSCYDLRMPKAELGRVRRDLRSNQRMRFDLDPWGRYLFTGDQHGRWVFVFHAEIRRIADGQFASYIICYRLLAYDATTFELTASTFGADGSDYSQNMDCLNSVSVHPYSSIAVSTSGQRHFEDSNNNSLDDSDLLDNQVEQSKDDLTLPKNSGIQIWNLRTTVSGWKIVIIIIV